MRLLLALLWLAAPGETTVRSVRIEAPLPERFAAYVGLVPGQPLDQEAVRRSVELLYATGEFEDVVVEAEAGPGGPGGTRGGPGPRGAGLPGGGGERYGRAGCGGRGRGLPGAGGAARAGGGCAGRGRGRREGPRPGRSRSSASRAGLPEGAGGARQGEHAQASRGHGPLAGRDRGAHAVRPRLGPGGPDLCRDRGPLHPARVRGRGRAAGAATGGRRPRTR